MNAGKRLIRETIFFNKKVVHCLLLLGRILPQLKMTFRDLNVFTVPVAYTLHIEKRFNFF
jgi:hypothetical protein